MDALYILDCPFVLNMLGNDNFEVAQISVLTNNHHINLLMKFYYSWTYLLLSSFLIWLAKPIKVHFISILEILFYWKSYLQQKYKMQFQKLYRKEGRSFQTIFSFIQFFNESRTINSIPRSQMCDILISFFHYITFAIIYTKWFGRDNFLFFYSKICEKCDIIFK